MKEQSKSIEKQIDSVLKKNENLNKKIKILESVPGVGKISAAVFLAEVPELGNITNKQIASLLGVAPHPHESGESKGRSSTAGGRRIPRKLLFMIALVASRHNEIFRDFYQRLIKSGKKAKVAIGAIMRKMIVLLNTMLKNETLWNKHATI